ncbi:Hint domain-containing protein [Roseicyclus persicicus]|uniref:Hint domain-containing protein n=1 Tax=Roseicyclus persicicus TaxID=2650661 RepID=A0A7X6JZR1_9RHOB|nr:Hint domain-containing protein [Roseibacterium persicicum]NKX45430.1 Hint domain-containing protein [Roseibacterium persicicum]
MPTTFNVIFLGVFPDLDTVEGNNTAENAAALVGTTVGGYGDSLINRVQVLSPGPPATDFDSDGNTYYDQNDPTPETFRINGGPTQGFDASVVYNATITYLDGTTATITAVVFQDTAGRTYLAPEFENNADQAALEAKPLLSITFNSLVGDTYVGMTGNRENLDFVPCFTAGTRLATPSGWRLIEAMAVGDRVMTQDHGFQPIRWIGRTTCRAEGALVPVRISRGALGHGLPDRDLMVSPQHRMLLRSRIAERLIGQREVLVPAKKLLGLPGIALATDLETVTYLHLLFDQHEILFAEGAPTESLLPGPQAIGALGPEAEAELRSLFPDLEAMGVLPARPIPRGRAQRHLVERHGRNGKPLIQ